MSYHILLLKTEHSRAFVSLLACKPLHQCSCSVLITEQWHLNIGVLVIVTHLLFMSALNALSISPSARALLTMMTVQHFICSHIACVVPPGFVWQHLLVTRSADARRVNASQFAAAAAPQYSVVSIGACVKQLANSTRASASVRSSRLGSVYRLEI